MPSEKQPGLRAGWRGISPQSLTPNLHSLCPSEPQAPSHPPACPQRIYLHTRLSCCFSVPPVAEAPDVLVMMGTQQSAPLHLHSAHLLTQPQAAAAPFVATCPCVVSFLTLYSIVPRSATPPTQHSLAQSATHLRPASRLDQTSQNTLHTFFTLSPAQMFHEVKTRCVFPKQCITSA